MSALGQLFKRTKLEFRIGDRAIHKLTGRRGKVVGIGTRVGPDGKYQVVSVDFDLSTVIAGYPSSMSDAAANEFSNESRSRHNG